MNRLTRLFSAKGILLFVSSLILCYTRYIVQYHNPPWKNGIICFIGSWFVHYFSIAIVAAIVLIILVKFGKYIFPDKDFSFGQNIEEVIAYVSLTTIAASLLILFIYFGGFVVDSYYE